MIPVGHVERCIFLNPHARFSWTAVCDTYLGVVLGHCFWCCMRMGSYARSVQKSELGENHPLLSSDVNGGISWVSLLAFFFFTFFFVFVFRVLPSISRDKKKHPFPYVHFQLAEAHKFWVLYLMTVIYLTHSANDSAK